MVSQNEIKYGYLNEWFEEIYLAFNLLLQHHYLKNYGKITSLNQKFHIQPTEEYKFYTFRCNVFREILQFKEIVNQFDSNQRKFDLAPESRIAFIFGYVPVCTKQIKNNCWKYRKWRRI